MNPSSAPDDAINATAEDTVLQAETVSENAKNETADSTKEDKNPYDLDFTPIDTDIK